MSPPALRLFVALELPGDVRGELVRWRAPVMAGEPGLRAVALDGLHVTLCFLGALPAQTVTELLVACGGVAQLAPARLTLGEALWLPRRAPRVLCVALEDAGGRLGAAQDALSRALAAGGWYEPDTRPFLPHVTVARVRRGARVRPRELPAPPALQFAGRRVTVFQSVLGRPGARYEALGSVELAGA